MTKNDLKHNAVLQIDLNTTVTVTSDHRLSLSVKHGGQIPAQRKTTDFMAVYSETSDANQVPGKQYNFFNLPYPFSFDIDFCSGEGN